MWKRMFVVVTSSLFLSVGTAVAEPTFDIVLDGNIGIPGSIIFGDNSVLSSANGLKGTVTSVGSGAGLTGGPITGSGTLSIAPGGIINSMLANTLLLPIANGGTGATTASAALTALGGVNKGGDTMTGNLTLPKVIYTSPREHVTSVSSEAFFPISNVEYANGGGARQPAGATAFMAAAVQLPDGATVTKFRVYFLDNSTQNLHITLEYQVLMSGGYTTLASVTTSGAVNAYSYLETTSITDPVIDNINNSYLIWVNPLSTWDDVNLMVRGAAIYYTLSEAP